MQVKEVPQDKCALENFTREVYYAKNSKGEYITELSTGWDVKKDALETAWDDIHKRVEDARNAVHENEKSPVYYFMELRLMDVSLLAKYTGFKKFRVKRHLKPAVFKKLNDEKLSIYANVFDIGIEDLKNFK